MNGETCFCGSQTCTASTGFYCTASTSTCAAGQPCSVQDGSSSNTVDCQCGTGGVTSICNKYNGFYCYFPEKKCQLIPDADWLPACTNTNSTAINNKACSCGASSCSTPSFVTTGVHLHYCTASASTCECSSSSYKKTKDAETCSLCEKGRYTDQSFQTSCKPCNAGRWSDEIGLSSSDQCKKCLAGTWSDNKQGLSAASQCKRCLKGTWSNKIGSDTNDCLVCSAGTYNDQEGLNVTCGNCPRDTFISDSEDSTKHEVLSDCLDC